MSSHEPHLILIADDDPDDRLLFELGIQRSGYKVALRFANNGTEVIDYLGDRDNPRPSLMFVNLMLPEVDAHKVISFMKSDPELDKIPVLVFTGSSEEDEVRKVYSESAKAYVIKPASMDDWVEKLNQIFKYWFETVRLPHLT